MRPEEVFAIDVAAELKSICTEQIQGPWQVPAEIVRLAVARGATFIEIGSGRGRLRFRCDCGLATVDELDALCVAFLDSAAARQRQRALSAVEAAGLTPLLWAAGMNGANLRLAVRSEGGGASLHAHRGAVDSRRRDDLAGPAETVLSWRCSGLSLRRANAWLQTAVRFVPIAVSLDGRPAPRGFRGGLFRMRIGEPLPAELAVTADGESAVLWLLEHGVLSARAVVPGWPPFAAAVEMSGVAAPGASSAELRRAINPWLPAIADQAARMAVLLAPRLAEMDGRIRARLVALTLGFAAQGIRRDEIMGLPVIPVRRGHQRWFESPDRVAETAELGSGVIPAATEADRHGGGSPRVEAGPEVRGLLAELIGLPVEGVDDAGRLGVRRAIDLLRRFSLKVRAAFRRRGLPPERQSAAERRLTAAASAAGRLVELTPGSGRACATEAVLTVGRDRPEVAVAAAIVDHDERWLYPALVAIGDEPADAPELRDAWLSSFD